jgi:hypothetical protein
MRPCLGVRIGCFPGAAYRPSSLDQPTDELGSLGLVKAGIRHPPEPLANDEVAPSGVTGWIG